MKLLYYAISVLLLVLHSSVLYGDDNFEIVSDNFYIYDIAIEGENIWCASGSDGIIKFNIIDKSAVQFISNDLSTQISKTYKSIAIDNNGNKWFGSGGGIIKYDNKSWEIFKAFQKEGWSAIKDVAVDKSGSLWFPNGSGITLYSYSKWTFYPGTSYDDVFVDHNNVKWFAGDGDRAKYDDEGFTYIEYDRNDDFIYNWVAVDFDDVQFWGDGSGLIVIEGDESTYYEDINATAFALDKYNITWIGSSNGLWKHENGDFSLAVDFEDYQSFNRVWDIEIDENGDVWMAIAKGIPSTGILAKYTPERIITEVEDSPKPEQILLQNIHPNPFNASTTIAFTLLAENSTKLTVYDISGRKVRELLDGHLRAGSHSITWNGMDENGEIVASGVYFTRLVSGGMSKAGKMVFVK